MSSTPTTQHASRLLKNVFAALARTFARCGVRLAALQSFVSEQPDDPRYFNRLLAPAHPDGRHSGTYVRGSERYTYQ